MNDGDSGLAGAFTDGGTLLLNLGEVDWTHVAGDSSVENVAIELDIDDDSWHGRDVH